MPVLTLAAASDIIIPTEAQHGFTSIVARKSILISGLEGKRIGYAYGSNAHFTILDVLASEGMTAADVKLVAMETNQMAEALASGRIDAFSSWEPAPSLALATNPDLVAIHRNMSTGYLYFHRALFNKHPAAVRHIIAAEVRALRALRSDPAFAARICERSCRSCDQVTGGGRHACAIATDPWLMSTDLLGTAGPPFIPKSSFADGGPLHREFRFLQAIGKVSLETEWGAVQQSFDRTILSEVLSAPITYSLIDPVVAMGN